MSTFSQETRQLQRCGFEPAADVGAAWQHSGYDGPEPTVCPGFTCTLPEVRETSRARLHWGKGALELWARGEVAELQLDAIEELEIQVSAVEAWCWKPKAEGGGRE